MMEAASSVQQVNQHSTIKRGRGRPALPDGEHKTVIRGARKASVERFLQACKEANIDTATKLDEILNRCADELCSADSVIARADREIEKRKDELAYFEGVKAAAVQRKEESNKYDLNSPEVKAAIAVKADLICSDPNLIARVEEFLEADAKDIKFIRGADRFPGVPLQSIKVKLRQAVNEHPRRHRR